MKDKLGDSFSRMHHIGFPACVQEGHPDFSPVVRVNHPDPLGHDNARKAAEAATGINKTGNPRLQDLNGDTGADQAAFTGGKDFFLSRAATQIHPHGPRSRLNQPVRAVEFSGPAEKLKANIERRKRKTCHRDAPMEECDSLMAN
jgi:hypothetical protein